jgi:hypothetical protein
MSSSTDSEPHTAVLPADTLERRSNLRASIVKASKQDYVAPADPPIAKQPKRENKSSKKKTSKKKTVRTKRKRSRTTESPPPSNPQTDARMFTDDDDDTKNDGDDDDDDDDDEQPKAPPTKRRNKRTQKASQEDNDDDAEEPKAPPTKRRKTRTQKSSQEDHDAQTKLASLVVASAKNHNDSDEEDYTQLVEGSDAFISMKDRIMEECGIGKRGQAYEAPLFAIGTNLGTKYGQREKTEVYVDFIDHAACQKPNADLPQCGVITLKYSKSEVSAMAEINWRSLELQAYKGQHMVAGLQRAVKHSEAVKKVQHNIYKSCMLIYVSQQYRRYVWANLYCLGGMTDHKQMQYAAFLAQVNLYNTTTKPC